MLCKGEDHWEPNIYSPNALFVIKLCCTMGCPGIPQGLRAEHNFLLLCPYLASGNPLDISWGEYFVHLRASGRGRDVNSVYRQEIAAAQRGFGVLVLSAARGTKKWCQQHHVPVPFTAPGNQQLLWHHPGEDNSALSSVDGVAKPDHSPVQGGPHLAPGILPCTSQHRELRGALRREKILSKKRS